MGLSKTTWLLIISASFGTGLILFAIQNDWLIVNFSSHQLTKVNTQDTRKFTKKKVFLWFWQNGAWHSEPSELLWGADSAANLTNLIQNWLVVLTEEQMLKTKVALQGVLTNQNQQIAYVSFDQALLDKNLSTFQKLLIIESLLKTVRDNHTNIQEVQFLVQHQIMTDPHLDFSSPWPVNGFLKN